jgi:hypothetical protein
MQHLAAAEALLSQKEDVQGTQVHRIDYEISVINRNQRNQSMPAPIRTGDHLKQPSSKWIDYSDYPRDAHVGLHHPGGKRVE